MTPQDQEFIHQPEIGQYGDCQRAVIASLLDLPISEVPHFLQISKGDASLFWENLQSFCKQHGFVYLTVPCGYGHAFFGLEEDIYHEISGPSPRGNDITHAVVGKGGKIVFDPHPSRAGLLGDFRDWNFGYLVKADF